MKKKNKNKTESKSTIFVIYTKDLAAFILHCTLYDMKCFMAFAFS